MSQRYFYIHGHFYQPPREDAITGEIPFETGVSPYRNWNERIHAECYKPNADLNNFERISFNIGPTLFQWMELYDPVTYRAIIDQDNRNYRRFGVGNAMAQAYNHVIMPLASRKDKLTQVKWGIADFRHRFGHDPSGMWLPEAAVDNESLQILAEHGIQFTILAPWQAEETDLDPSQPYRVELEDGLSIVVFFYQMEISSRISFDPGSTVDADQFIQAHLLPLFGGDGMEHQLISAASDGELYGHHQPFREKFLERLLTAPELEGLVYFTYPARYLAEHAVTRTCRIRPRTSWSCHHGVERWQGDCECTPGSLWKAPLRRALDKVASSLDQEFQRAVSRLGMDAWELRDGYIHVMLGEETLPEYVARSSGREMIPEEIEHIRSLLESQLARQKMYTSCAFFFDELNRIEPRNSIAYAAQATLLHDQALKMDLGRNLAGRFRPVKSSRFPLDGESVFTDNYCRAEANLRRRRDRGH